MVYQSEFRHDSNARFVDDANDDDIKDEGEVEGIVNLNEEKKPSEQPKVYQKRNFRTGCKAHIQFYVDKDSGLYVVVNHTMVHNHSKVPVFKRHLIRSHRKVTNEQVVMLSSLTESSIPVADAVRVLKHQAGGEANLSFLCRDAYGHLQYFFFRDNRMKVDYDAFGDRAHNDLSARAVIEEAIEECTARIKLLMGEDKDVPLESSKMVEQDITQDKGDGSLLEPPVIFEELAEDHGGPVKEHGGLEKEHGGNDKEHAVEVDVKDPIQKRKKGQKNIRWKSTQEKISNKLKGQNKVMEKEKRKGCFKDETKSTEYD
uniref:Protein FAR1-RELATED SEQUENCE n=1 Tax=Chenopodium quinoa TaxID=63459 RepID=A0A803LQL6_CHEQI